MHEILSELFARPAGAAAIDDIDGWRRHVAAALPAGASPVAEAVLGGLLADRLGWAFAAGYRAALRALVPEVTAVAALCVTEEGGAHPRAIRATLGDDGAGGYRLSGRKKWTTMAARAERLLVAATAGVAEDGRSRIRLVVVDAHAPGVTMTEMPAPPFVPEISHAEVAFEAVAVAAGDVLPGDGWTRYVKPFRTVEDIHVHLALAGHLVGLGRAHGWPRELVEDLAAQVAAFATLAAADPGARATHLALAGGLRAAARVVAECEPHIAAIGGDTAARWQRDRPLLSVASRARAERREAAWRALAGAAE